MTGFDPSLGDSEKLAKINQNLRANLGDLENPLDDAVQYGLTLLMAQKALRSQDHFHSKESLSSCINLLGGNKETSYEVSSLLKKARDQFYNLESSGVTKKLSSSHTNKLFEDFLEFSCDVESLNKIREITKQGQSGNQIKNVLSYINENLKFTADERRKHISIKQFLDNDSGINFELIDRAVDKIITDKTQKLAKNSFITSECGIEGASSSESVLKSLKAQANSDLLLPHVRKQLQQSLDKQRVFDKSTLEVYSRDVNQNSQFTKQVKNKIEKAVTLSDDLEFSRARLENQLIRAFTFCDVPKTEVDSAIQNWIDLRITDMRSKPEFLELQNTEYRNIMINKLKKNIIAELGLDKLTDNAREFEKLNPINPRDGFYSNDISNITNLSNVLKNAVGYENLVERLQNPNDSKNLAYASFAEELLAEYYNDKRRDYQASRQMLESLNKEFNHDTFYNKQKTIGQDLRQHISQNNKNIGGLHEFDALANTTRENPVLFAEDTQYLIELGNATNHAIQGDTQGIAQSLIEAGKGSDQWPDRLEKFDLRRTPKEWVEEKLLEVLDQLFSSREYLERNVPVYSGKDTNSSRVQAYNRQMSRNELLELDKQLMKHLSKDEMVLRLIYELDKEYME